MNNKKNIFFFALFLLSIISFSSWAQPYIRIEELDQSISGGLGGDVDIIYSANPTVKLYADSACTIPYTTTTDLEVAIHWSTSYGELRNEPPQNYDYGSSDDIFTITVPAGHSTYELGARTLSTTSIYYYYWSLGTSNPIVETMYTSSDSYYVGQQSGYEALPTVERPYEIRYETYYGAEPNYSLDYRFYEN